MTRLPLPVPLCSSVSVVANTLGSHWRRSVRAFCACTGSGQLTVSAAWMLVPSMPTSPSFCSFPGFSAKARGLTFLARMCALHQHRQHELSEHQQLRAIGPCHADTFVPASCLIALSRLLRSPAAEAVSAHAHVSHTNEA